MSIFDGSLFLSQEEFDKKMERLYFNSPDNIAADGFDYECADCGAKGHRSRDYHMSEIAAGFDDPTTSCCDSTKAFCELRAKTRTIGEFSQN